MLVSISAFIIATAAYCQPGTNGGDVVVGHCLPHLPPNAVANVAIDGHSIQFPAWERETIMGRAMVSPGMHSLSLSVRDPQVPRRLLYTRSTPISVPEGAPPEGDTGLSRITFGLDGISWESSPVGDGPTVVGGLPAVPRWLHGEAYPAGALEAEVSLQPQGGTGPAERPLVAAGTAGIRAELAVSNPGEAPVRIISAALRIRSGEDDCTSRFFVLAASSIPPAIGPGGSAVLSFRIDTFHDVEPGRYTVDATVVCAPADADLLTDGGFETCGEVPAAGPDGQLAWEQVGAEGAEAGIVAGGGEYGSLADRIADWVDFTALGFSNDARIQSQGDGLLEVALPQDAAPGTEVAVRQRVALSADPATLIVGAASWSGEEVGIEFTDEGGAALAGHGRNFTGFWWTHRAATWRTRCFPVTMPAGARYATLTLRSAAARSWWDNCFVIPEDALRKTTSATAQLTITDPEPHDGEASSVVYLGEDWSTQGDWLGKYGDHCWTLCAMSAPRDMVGGKAKPLKCHHDDMSKAYANETLRVTGDGEFRYCSWTGDPADVLTRHWIGVKKSDETRALENPQWGYRTYASWDEHGEMHPTDAKWPDLFVKLRMPPGLWQVSFYFIDWDWFGAPFPRAHRIAFLNETGDETCTARVSDFGDGVYKIFGVEGGRDVVLRIRKDFSATVVLSGIFLDPISPPELPTEVREQLRADEPAVAARLDELAATYRDAPAEYLGMLGEYGELADAVAPSDPEAPTAPWRRQAQYSLWDRVPGASARVASRFAAYAAALSAGNGKAAPAEALEALGHAHFAEDEVLLAELAYDQALRLSDAEGTALADRYMARAEQFRIIHPLYARQRCVEARDIVRKLRREEVEPYLHAAAARLMAVADGDWKQGRGLVRVPYLLPTDLYRDLVLLCGYGDLPVEDRANLVRCLERQTWYDVGFGELTSELERLVESLPEGEVTGALLRSLLRSYAVVCQGDAAYIAKAEALTERMRGELPDGDYTLDGVYRMAQIYNQAGRVEQAKVLLEEIIATWPDEPEAKEAQRLLDGMTAQ